eukprot:15169124-Heterocapsa_arctica.AAC.1
MEAYSDHSNIPQLYHHQVRPSIKPGRKQSGKAHSLLFIVMIGYIAKIINDCNSNKEMCGIKESSEHVHVQSMEAYSDHSKIPELYQHQ